MEDDLIVRNLIHKKKLSSYQEESLRVSMHPDLLHLMNVKGVFFIPYVGLNHFVFTVAAYEFGYDMDTLISRLELAAYDAGTKRIFMHHYSAFLSYTMILSLCTEFY